MPFYRVPIAVTLAMTLAGCSLGSRGERRETPDENRRLPGEQPTSQVIDPNTARPRVAVRKLQQEFYEAGPYVGAINTAAAGTLGLYGVRAAYAKSESIFIEVHYAFASTFGYNDVRKLVGAEEIDDTDYETAGIGMGWNALPGEIYLGTRYTIPIVFYGMLGTGYTSFKDDSFATYSIAAGLKLLAGDAWSLRLEVRDEIWSVDGTDHNAEATVGLGFFF